MSDEISPRTDPQISMYLKTSDAEGVSGTEPTDFDEGSLETPLLEIEEMNVEDKHEGHESMLNTTPLEVGFASSLFARHTTSHLSQVTVHSAEANRPTTALERMKRRIEYILQGKVSWWPLEAPSTECRLDQSTISWKCVSALRCALLLHHS
jgi:hypothetical protein